MRCLLLALCVALVCGVRAKHIPQKMEDLDKRKVAGTWHTMAMAASDISLLDAESSPLRVYVEELKATPEGNLEMVLQKRVNHGCAETTITARKTEDPTVKISVLDTDYTHYLFFCMERAVTAPTGGVVCQYLARTLKVDDEVMEKFRGALEPLPVHMRIFLDLSQGKGELPLGRLG
uniref:Lipocalin/cytosolic fatty-acid binding domain-containing protein n=1 Tax=Catagonus wagneri TaxID=51154 RepID=A0A8C3VQU9_9CETA